MFPTESDFNCGSGCPPASAVGGELANFRFSTQLTWIGINCNWVVPLDFSNFIGLSCSNCDSITNNYKGAVWLLLPFFRHAFHNVASHDDVIIRMKNWHQGLAHFVGSWFWRWDRVTAALSWVSENEMHGFKNRKSICGDQCWCWGGLPQINTCVGNTAITNIKPDNT